MWSRRQGCPRFDTPFAKAVIQVSDNQSDNEISGEVCDRTPISGLSVEFKSVWFDRKEIFSDATNSWNRPTDALLRECAVTTDKI